MEQKEQWNIYLRIWFWIQLIVVTFDASFVLLKPLSLPGHALGFMYPAFHKYMEVDLLYQTSNAFGNTISTVCLIENFIIAVALYVYNVYDSKKSSDVKCKYLQLSDMIAFMALSMQFGKSILYWLNDVYGGFGHVKHNNIQDLILFFILPNIIWLIAPVAIVILYYIPKLNNTINACDNYAHITKKIQ